MTWLRVVGLVLWAWSFGAAGATLALLWRPRGFYLRWVQWIAQITCLIMVVWIWTPAARGDGLWWQKASLEAGIVTIGSLAVIKRRSLFPERKRRDVPIARWRWMWDYFIGLSVYLLCVYALTWAHTTVHTTHGTAEVIGAVIGYFVAAQLTTSAALRVIHASISEDYGLRRGAHYILAVILVLAALGLVVSLGGSVASYVFSLVVLAIGWRFTEERPNATLKILRSVVRQLGTGFRPKRLRPDALSTDSSPAGTSGSPTSHSDRQQGRKRHPYQR